MDAKLWIKDYKECPYGYDDIDLLCDLKQGSGLRLMQLMFKNHSEFANDIATYIQTKNEIWLEKFFKEYDLEHFWKYIPSKKDR